MVLLRSLPDETKRKIITEIVATFISLSKEEIERGIKAFDGKLDDLLFALLKTPTLDFDNRTIRLAILTKHLGAEIATNEAVINLLLMEPTRHDLAMLFALSLISNEKKVKNKMEKLGI